MAITLISTEDIIASIESYAQATWPDANVAYVPTAHEAFDDDATTAEDAWASFQWLSFDEDEPNRDGRLTFELRVVCFSREADRLGATRRADQFAEIFTNVTVTVYDRSDGGSTAIAKAALQTAVASPPTLTDRGVRFATLDVMGTVYPD